MKTEEKEFKELVNNHTLTLERDGNEVILSYDQLQHVAYMKNILDAREIVSLYVDNKFFGEKESKYLEEKLDDYAFCEDIAVVFEEESLVVDIQMAEINTLEWALSSDEANAWLSSH